MQASDKMVCPVCTVAVAAGVGVLRELGVNDAITGIWFGALIVSSIAWMIDWLNRKNIHFIFKPQLVIVLFYLIFIWPLYFWGIMGNPANVIFGMDRLLFGVIIGTAIFILSMIADGYLRKVNEQKILIRYQKVIIPIVLLIVTSIIMFLLLGIYGVK
jgi:hypothetical protein